MSLTDRSIAALPFPKTGQKFHPDRSIPGFGVRVSQGGAKTFMLVVGIERRKISIGRYPVVSLSQARDKAKTLLAQRQLGLDKSLSAFYEDVEEEYRAFRQQSLRSSTVRKDLSYFKYFASLDRKRIAEITPQYVQKLIDAVPAMSSRQEVHNRFAGLIRFALKRGHVDAWPIHRLEYPAATFVRDRVLNDDELRAVLCASKIWQQTGHAFGYIIELLVRTGQRRQQIATLHSSHVNFRDGTITWPADLMKSGRKHTIVMGRSVAEILKRCHATGLYFPNRYGEPYSFSSTTLNLFKRDCGVSDFRLHDFRRGLATRWQELGIEIATTEKMLSHSAITGGLVGIYQRSNYLTQMSIAVQKHEEWLQTLLSNTGDTNGPELPGLHYERARAAE